jgi:hypothetical protein
MRDRLIELVKPFVSGSACEQESGVCEFTDCRTCNAQVLADHLLANGVIVPPCKVGDTVYILVGEPSRTIKEFRVRTIVFGRTHDSIGFANKSLFTIWDKRWYDFFGKIIFTTKEEAEKALAEREGK